MDTCYSMKTILGFKNQTIMPENVEENANVVNKKQLIKLIKLRESYKKMILKNLNLS